MARYTLYTYEDIDEYNKHLNEIESQGETIHSFLVEETGELLRTKRDITIDISALVKNVPQNQTIILNALYNLRNIDESTEIIIISELADLALKYFYELFENTEPLYAENESIASDDTPILFQRKNLYTYENVDEFNKLLNQLNANGNTIHNFAYEEMEHLLNDSNDVIDISAVVEQIKANPSNLHPAIYYLKDICSTNKVIIKSELAVDALGYLYLLFDKSEPLYELNDQTQKEIRDGIIPLKRKILYTYENSLQLDNIIEFLGNNDIPFTNFSKLNGSENNTLKLLCNEENKVVLDITNVLNASIKNTDVIYLVEHVLDSFPYYEAIIREDIAEEALDLYRFLFSSKKPVEELMDGIMLSKEKIIKHPKERVKKIIDLKSRELLYQAISSQLIGHGEFKRRFKEYLESFIILNSINEKKIFSIFLLGDSGLGKTEVARIIKRTLNNNTSLVKINFGNYSSDNALNSLMGSPRGYIGSEEGELSLKISQSKAGIILCDEFEKATQPVFNFFLELLEDGVFTDSQSVEYNLDGYIIVFTSNITENEYYTLISQEFQSRIDLVCEFTALQRDEKLKYVDYQIQTFLEKLKVNKDLKEFSKEEIESFRGINVDSTDNLREIKRILQREMLNKLKDDLFV